MMFETTYRIGAPMIELSPDAEGDIYEIHMVTPVLAALPVGPGQLALMQMGIVRMPMDADMVEALRKGLDEAAPMMKKRSQIQTASNMSEAEILAEMRKKTENLRG